MTINDRIIVLINLLEEGIKRSFAKKTGIPEGTLSSIVGARRSDLSYTILKKNNRGLPGGKSRVAHE